MTESLHDITERKKLQQELGETQERLAVATSSARVGVWHWDIANNELTWNDQTKVLFGLRADAKLDYHAFVEKIHPADREQMKQQVTSATKAGKDYETEYRLMLPDGSTRWILSRGKAFHDSSGNPIAMTGIVMDITERKIQQEQLEKLNRQFEARTKEYEAVISFVSHDLRSPIVNVKGFGGELRRDLEMLEKVLSDVELPQKAKRDVEMVLGESVPESLGFIEKSAETMEILLTSLVQVTRAGLAAVSPEKIDMDELIANILASLEFKIQQAGATVRVDKLPPCTADKPQAGRIFSNLIDNALKYLDKSRPGSIRIWGIASGNESMYCVEDNGLGIAPEYQKRIFEIFYRVSQKVQGEGIGLAMVKRMVDRNNGRIWVESEQGKGSRFFVALPK
jgi:PAS domain S-box-containing protein